ncbi:2-hydroxy-6-oxonona-2,4-dienedioate hydrolase [Raineyella antarctica]|uniref:2-hydroxy-6-oxonona-2,4-dienedioate hydrolase n=1 Tax=Raineyella antarctica TaxID=1577474 RepID=A0A1G6GXS9_9ACTN|nr:alpha/beta hydrolase [Raineyella antarctica]SDB86698.1 2-hydroxy-6-oxonona-2,4-dienedioate hydrolase [Raineyella antarctica]
MDVTYEETFKKVVLPDGTTVAYNEAGEGDQALILIHGSGPGATGWSNFNPNIGTLADDFHVYAVDMPGWGESSPRPAAEYRHPEVLVQFMDAVGIDRAALVGNSMGGMIALAVAARHPERVSHLITMGPGSGGVTINDAGGGLSEGLKILYKGYADPSPENFEATVEIMTYDTPKEVAAPLAVQRSQNARKHQEHLDNWLQGSVDGPPLRYAASEREIMSITAPALLIHGRDDRVVPFEHTLRLVRMIGNSRAYLINRCGHWAQLEHATEFNRLVRDFVLSTTAAEEEPELAGVGG